jgi:hypothetical protein
MRTKEVETTLDDSARRAAHPDTEVTEDVPCHASFLECFGAGAPCTGCVGAIRPSDVMSSQVGGHRTRRALHEQVTAL